MQVPTNSELEDFAVVHDIEGVSKKTLAHIFNGYFKVNSAKKFLGFQERLSDQLLCHPVIINNIYTRWFEQADLSDIEVKQFLVQFSVFLNQLLVAQLHKMLNAPTLDEMNASREILLGELGVVFGDGNNHFDEKSDSYSNAIAGVIDQGVFHLKRANFEFLVRLAGHLGIPYQQLGRKINATRSTMFFAEELVRLYGSEDYTTATAASYALENWVTAGFWQQLVIGLNNYKTAHGIGHLSVGDFAFSNQLEQYYAKNTQASLEHLYFSHQLDEDLFIDKGNEMLDAIFAFWEGLEVGRQQLH